MAVVTDAIPNAGRGLFDDFGAYQTPTTSDFTAVLKDGLVAPDANVLLNLYRYTEQARTDLLRTLGALGDRLFVPHQVVEEFWRNRESVITDARSTSTNAAQEMSSHTLTAVQTLRTWANRVALSDEDFTSLRDRLTGVFDEVQKKITEIGEGEWQSITPDTGIDPVIPGLERALAGRAGSPFNPEEILKLTEVGGERIKKRVPPGYMDAKKDGDGAVGDFFVWEQLLRAASECESDVLFVTGDVKEDWWRKEHGHNRGPRPELSAELRRRGGGRLFLLSPKQFLEVAAPILQLSLQAGSVEDIERVERIETEPSRGGWTTAAIEELFNGLTYEGYGNRVDVIRYAADMDGYIEAVSVYDICDYDDDRSLRGFTKPIRRISEKLVEQGVIPDSAVPVLAAEYQSGSGRASGFKIDPLLVPLINDLADDEDQ
ncbi:PIN domain-containing protein [Streptomyces fuscigenes]|uniref:PIN domain-containing protein n=1 Tax=Streptomyces fuscigenes TaxID=1528880 RepID=UPI001F2CE3B4|nr:PIN-like domain-containing protein [Streptomyces fuscigenes]MCF3960410.1 PIN domain-containing protein [Streptomyces fuscigenes]